MYSVLLHTTYDNVKLLKCSALLTKRRFCVTIIHFPEVGDKKLMHKVFLDLCNCTSGSSKIHLGTWILHNTTIVPTITHHTCIQRGKQGTALLFLLRRSDLLD